MPPPGGRLPAAASAPPGTAQTRGAPYRPASSGSPQATAASKPTEVENLIRYNGELVESLYISPVWTEIIEPLITEGIASVSGRKTNGRYYHGDITKPESRRDFSAGYQKALMDFNNYLNDFVLEKNKLIKARKEEELDKESPLFNPFLEEE